MICKNCAYPACICKQNEEETCPKCRKECTHGTCSSCGEKGTQCPKCEKCPHCA